MASEPRHDPVMAREVVELLQGRSRVLDMTLGAGGHAEALLEAGVEQVIGLDRDRSAVTLSEERLKRFGSRSAAIVARFADAPDVGHVEGVLYDLGVSSMQLDEPERGFSFRAQGPLDMRMAGDAEHGPSAMELVNSTPEEELSLLLWEFGEERRSRNIARAIVRARERAPIETTDQLTSVVASAVGRRKGGPHPARRTFQALRIAVNRELEELTASLPQAVELLAPGGRLVVIAYHSLEDRIVKRSLLAEAAAERVTIITKKPVQASKAERARNPRSRAAKLRAAERTAAPSAGSADRAPDPSPPQAT